MLVIKQIRNSEPSVLFTKQNYTLSFNIFSKMTELLLQEGAFREGDRISTAGRLKNQLLFEKSGEFH